MQNDPLSHGLWEMTALPAPPTLPRNAEVRADVAIIGCGYTGLSAALHCAQAGAKVVALEAVEIGFGSGLNLPYLSRDVTRLLAVVPSGRAREIAKARIEQSTCPVEFVGLDAEVLQMPDAAADAALSTFTLCTVPDAVRALREVKRVLKPGG